MTWITPKTNWSPNDYYNLEDAQRIAGNICHLKDMAKSVYGNQNITCFTIRYTASDQYVYFCGRSTINPYSILVVQPSEYYLGMTSWLSFDSTNSSALTYLMMLSKESAPGRHSFHISDNYNIRYPNGPYWLCDNEDCIVNYKDYYGHSGEIDYRNNAFRAIWGESYLYYEDEFSENFYWSHHTVARRPGYTGDDLEQCDTFTNSNPSKLFNKPFYSFKYLYTIESKILEVYNLLTSYQEA